MDLSIIILNYRQRGLVKQCLRGILLAQPRCTYEVIVVDNDSRDGCLEMVAEFFPWALRVPSPANRGFGAGNNLGIAVAAGRAILVMNPDIALFPGQLETLLDFLDAHPRAAIIGPQLAHPDGTIQASCFRFPGLLIPFYRRTWLGRLPAAQRQLRHFLMRDFDHAVARPVDWLMGACLLLRRSALSAIGTFDERFFMYFEDLDLCRRAWQAGFEVWYVPAARATHYHQRQSAEHGGLRVLWYGPAWQHLRSAVLYYRKYWGQVLPAVGRVEQNDGKKNQPPGSSTGQAASRGVR